MQINADQVLDLHVVDWTETNQKAGHFKMVDDPNVDVGDTLAVSFPGAGLYGDVTVTSVRKNRIGLHCVNVVQESSADDAETDTEIAA